MHDLQLSDTYLSKINVKLHDFIIQFYCYEIPFHQINNTTTGHNWNYCIGTQRHYWKLLHKNDQGISHFDFHGKKSFC